jgi:hypothetical protein
MSGNDALTLQQRIDDLRAQAMLLPPRRKRNNFSR